MQHKHHLQKVRGGGLIAGMKLDKVVVTSGCKGCESRTPHMQFKLNRLTLDV